MSLPIEQMRADATRVIDGEHYGEEVLVIKCHVLDLADEVERLTAVNAALLEACEVAIATIDSMGFTRGTTTDILVAAVVKAKGEKRDV